jgi:putative ABC transport system permease protein
MLRNYLLIAIRNLRRGPGFTAINILGLALGLSCCLLIALFVIDELGHDRQHPDVDRLYRIGNHITASDDVAPLAITPAILAATAEAQLPEVDAFVRIHPAMGPLLMRRGETRAFEEEVFYTDASFLQLFGFPLASGDPATALAEPFSAVLTPSVATRYFGDEDPVGRTLRIDESYEYTVTGLLADDPTRSHLRFGALLSMRTLEGLTGVSLYGADGRFFNSYHLAAGYSYVRLTPGADAESVSEKLTAIVRDILPPDGPRYQYELQPVSDIYLRSDLLYDLRTMGSLVYVWAFVAIALFMLGIACINYMNLATARSMGRMLEVGVRKALGAERRQLGQQFLAESMLTTAAAAIVAVILALMALPLFNALAGKELTSMEVLAPPVLLGLLAGTLVVGLLSGSYPAIALSSMPPMSTLRRSGANAPRGAGLRRLLVVVQFAAAVVLLVGTATIYRQLAFFTNQDLGFDQEQLVYFRIPDPNLIPQIDLIKERIVEHPGVARVAATSSIPGRPTWRHDTRPAERPAGERWVMAFYAVDHDLIETLDLEIVEGRSFSTAYASDSTQAYVLNEAAVSRLGWQGEAVGKEFGWFTAQGLRNGRVVGVVRDFHFESLRSAIEPTFFAISTEYADIVAVRLRAGQSAGALRHLESIWKDVLPAYPFEYAFLDETLREAYEAEHRFGGVFGLFTLLTMFIACLGLFGLATFTARQRTREVGVRKVLGASVPSIVALLSTEFLKLVGIAFVLAVPIAFIVMRQWLNGFAYRIELGPSLFVAAGLVALAIALVTVAGQALRAATADPTQALRSE